jgi:hypothetical protein
MAHTESIEILLTTVHMCVWSNNVEGVHKIDFARAATRINGRKNDDYHRSLAGKIQESYFGCMGRLNVVLERISMWVSRREFN